MKFTAPAYIWFALVVLIPANATAFCFENAGNTYGINPTLLENIARVESSLNPNAVNKNANGTSDIGLMQINSAWLKQMGVNADELLRDACLNTMTGARILRQCIDRHGYNWEAVGCYNAMSHYKKVDYAWKVFYRLKGDRNGSGQNPGRLRNTIAPIDEKQEDSRVAVRPAQPSLVFRVRDITEKEKTIP